MNLERRPAGLSRTELDRHRARVFIGQRCVLGSTLVMPAWLLWKAFEAYGVEEGFAACPKALRSLLDEVPWAEVQERPEARGRFKSIVRGVGMKPMVRPEAG